jgi:hypothetical protein
MAILVDHDVRLGKKCIRRLGSRQCLKSYPLEIPVYHCLAMHVYQSISDAFELLEGVSATGAVGGGSETYKLKPVYNPMRLDELIDVPVYHPF